MQLKECSMIPTAVCLVQYNRSITLSLDTVTVAQADGVGFTVCISVAVGRYRLQVHQIAEGVALRSS